MNKIRENTDVLTAARIVSAVPEFRDKINRILFRHGDRKKVLSEMKISRQAFWKFLSSGTVRESTLMEIVRKFEGDQADINDYIQKL